MGSLMMLYDARGARLRESAGRAGKSWLMAMYWVGGCRRRKGGVEVGSLELILELALVLMEVYRAEGRQAY